MKSEKQVKEYIGTLRSSIDAQVKNYAKIHESEVKKVVGKPITEAETVIADTIYAISAFVKGSFVDGIGFPDFTSKFSYADEAGKEFELVVKNRSPRADKFKTAKTVVVSENLVQDIADVISEVMLNRFVYQMAKSNVQELNAVVAEICEQHEITIIPEFGVDVSTQARILSVSNTEVVFNVTFDEAMEIPNVRICSERTDEYNEYLKTQAIDTFVEEMKAVHTVPQLIKANVGVVTSVVGAIKSRADIMIRKAYHKQAKNIGKSGIGYFDETVKIKKQDVQVFAIVEKSADGEYSVVLNPFDKETLAYVDFDVIKAISK